MKPTLQEIADAPFPSSLKIVRESYDPNWGKAADEQKYYVTLGWEIIKTDQETFCVSADSPEDAIDKAREFVDADYAGTGDIEWDFSKVLDGKPEFFIDTTGGEKA